MPRSKSIHLVLDLTRPADPVVAAFTVKWECDEWLLHFDPTNRFTRSRVADSGDEGRRAFYVRTRSAQVAP